MDLLCPAVCLTLSHEATPITSDTGEGMIKDDQKRQERQIATYIACQVCSGTALHRGIKVIYW